jgi:hypothetical protein
MITHFVLLGVLLTLIVALELLNAYFERLFNTQKAALDEDIEAGRNGSGAVNSVWLGVRMTGAKLIAGLAFASLYVHELMHAIAQLASGTKPRIVVCKNGGYAEARPWAESGPAQLIAALGIGLLRGVCGMAPLLGGSVLVYLTVRFTAPLDAGTLGTLADGMATATSFGAVLSAFGGALSTLLAAIAGAPIWAILMIGLVALLLGWGLTPSSADFHNAAPHLLGYLLAYLTAAASLPSPWILIAIGAVGVPAYLLTLIKLKPGLLAWLIGGYSMSCGVLGLLALLGVLGDAPAVGLARGLGALIVLFGLAGCMYAAFVAVLFGLALCNSPSAAFVRRTHGSAAAPGLLASLVTSFDTCTSCKLHFRGRCDGCGRTAEELRAAAG